MPQQPPPQLRITEPAEVAQIIPYLLGFTPENSLVVSALQNGRVQVTARVDLAVVQPVDGVENLLERIWSRYPGAGAVAVAYTDDHLAGWDVLSRCDAWLPHGATTMLIDADTWHTPDGTRGTIDPNGGAATQAAQHGLTHLPSRTELEARFNSAPDSDELDRQVGDALTGLPGSGDTHAIVRLTGQLLDRNLPNSTGTGGQAGISVKDAVQLSVLAQHPAARDLALLRIDRDNATQHLALWQSVIQNSPTFGADMALYVAGMAAWISGDGASAAIAVERSLAAEPAGAGRHPALLLDGIIDNVVSPETWEALRGDIAEHAHPAVRDALPAKPGHAPRKGWPPSPPPATRQPERDRHGPPSPGLRLQP